MSWEDAVGEVVVGARVEGGPDVHVRTDLTLPDLYRAQFEPMVRVATALLGDRAAAEDVVQDAFVAVGRKLAVLHGSEVAYLRRAVVNGCRSSVRRVRAAKRRPVALGADAAGADVDAAAKAQHERVLAALDALSDRQRQCLILRYYAGLTDVEIADATGLGLGSAKTHLRRGLAALRSSLEDLDG